MNQGPGLFERPKSGERAILVQARFKNQASSPEAEEFEALARAAGAVIVGCLTVQRTGPDPKFFIGLGKLAELQSWVSAEAIELVLVNYSLTPGQEKHLEQFLKCRLVDRTGLILDIFAARARTHEGKLQVELAQLRHWATRLVRGWTHLERQRGGIGLRGPGETQLELDKRLIQNRRRLLIRRLEKLKSQREQSRQARRSAQVPTVCLVGYTNAGKSTLFNALTGATVLSANQLFATLDPTWRRLHLKGIGDAVLVDTVGFIQDLPHALIEAFNATLQETAEADLLLHVIDYANPNRREQAHEVEKVLAQIEALGIPRLAVYNKIDLQGMAPHVESDLEGRPVQAFVSASKALGLEELKEAISDSLFDCGLQTYSIRLLPEDAALRAWLHAYGDIKAELFAADGSSVMTVRLVDWRFQAGCLQFPKLTNT